jgi:hypothetical protein
MVRCFGEHGGGLSFSTLATQTFRRTPAFRHGVVSKPPLWASRRVGGGFFSCEERFSLARKCFWGRERAGRGFPGACGLGLGFISRPFSRSGDLQGPGGISLVFKTVSPTTCCLSLPAPPNPSSPRTADPEKRERENTRKTRSKRSPSNRPGSGFPLARNDEKRDCVLARMRKTHQNPPTNSFKEPHFSRFLKGRPDYRCFVLTFGTAS